MFYAVPQCRNILTALDHPMPPAPQNASQDTQRGLFRTAVRGAIGLPALAEQKTYCG
jgi:hypothetical protein